MDSYKNFAYGTVATAPSPATSGTSLSLQTGQGARFPSVPFDVVAAPPNVVPTSANSEILRVTQVSSDEFTITRTQAGTTAKEIGTDWAIYQSITERTLGELRTTYFDGGSSTTAHFDTIYNLQDSTDSAADIIFSGGTSND